MLMISQSEIIAFADNFIMRIIKNSTILFNYLNKTI